MAPPRTSGPPDPVTLTLAVAACIAVAFATVRVALVESPTIATVPGADVSGLDLATRHAAPFALAGGVRTVVYVFDSGCGHCERLAPAWREWLATHPDVRTVAVSREPLEKATTFVERHGWSTEVAHIDLDWPDLRVRSFVARTPWVFVVDRDGRVETALYGGALEELSQALSNQGTDPHRKDT